MINRKKPVFLIIIVAVVAFAAAVVCLLTRPAAATYKMSEMVYADGVFSYCMSIESAPIIEIDRDMNVYEQQTAERKHCGVFGEAKLTDSGFDSLFKHSPMWTGYESTTEFKAAVKKSWITDKSEAADGIYPYMLLQDDSGDMYIVYTNVDDGKPECIRWIYRLEKADAN